MGAGAGAYRRRPPADKAAPPLAAGELFSVDAYHVQVIQSADIAAIFDSTRALLLGTYREAELEAGEDAEPPPT